MKSKQLFLTLCAGLAILVVGSDSSLTAKGMPAANSGAARPDASSGAAVVGKVKFQGTLPQPAKVSIYDPHVVAVRANQKLKMVNSDNTTHNVHPIPANNREWNKAEPAGSTMEESFPREEIAIPVKCNVHPWMKSYIAVFKHPYFAVTGKDGSFQLPNLPPGEYTLEAWHEKLGTMTQKITVAAGESKTVDFTFKAH